MAIAWYVAISVFLLVGKRPATLVTIINLYLPPIVLLWSSYQVIDTLVTNRETLRERLNNLWNWRFALPVSLTTIPALILVAAVAKSGNTINLFRVIAVVTIVVPMVILNMIPKRLFPEMVSRERKNIAQASIFLWIICWLGIASILGNYVPGR